MPHSHSATVRRRRARHPLLVAPAALVALLLVLAACTSATSAPPDTQEGEPSATAMTEESAPASEDGGESAPPTGDGGQEVSINGTSFGADEITVAVGDTVTWTNNSSLPHTVTEGTDGNAADGARFNEDIPAGETVEVTFDEVGDYDVTCLFHGNMNMVVHVE